MNKIAEAFSGKKAFITYIMAGDPEPSLSAKCILAAQEAGADLIELGIPFSDPIAEGPVIQEASVRALQAGVHTDEVFALVESLRGQIRVPLVFMTYLNPVFAYGYVRFFERCRDVGISGIIIPDLPFEEQDEVKSVASRFGVALIVLIAPTSGERIRKIAAQAEGFVYLVSSMGVTGMRDQIISDIDAAIQEIRAVTDVPVAVGFGIHTPEQAARYAQAADGVIVGSAIVRLFAQHGEEAPDVISQYVRGMRAAIR